VEITVSARHTELPEALRQATREKIGRLSRFLEGMDRADVHFSQERNPRIPEREVCEVVLEGHGHHVRCKVRAADGFTAVDKAAAKLEQQLHKLKTKLQRRNQGADRARAQAADADTAVAVATPPDADGGHPDAPRIVKVKRHDLVPMSPDEAALQLDLLGHDFYFFTNAETGRGAVLYRRDDGDLGLIDAAG
jgi:putative sigma-54 modulation protein